MKLYKPARDKDLACRGIFSYITEGVCNLSNFPAENKLYWDLENCPPYLSRIRDDQNLFSWAFIQDELDWKNNREQYRNIELEIKNASWPTKWGLGEVDRNRAKSIARELVLQPDILNEVNTISQQINTSRCIGVVDRRVCIHYDPADFYLYIKNIESLEFDSIFLTTDSNDVYKFFKNRYGDRLISLEDFSGRSIDLEKWWLDYSDINKTPSPPDPYHHVREVIRNIYILSRCKTIIASKSNSTDFMSFISDSEIIDMKQGKAKYRL